MTDYSPYDLQDPKTIQTGPGLRGAWQDFVIRFDSFPSVIRQTYYVDLLARSQQMKVPLQFTVHPSPAMRYPLTATQVREISRIVDGHVQAFLYETMGYDLDKMTIKDLIRRGILDKNVTRSDFPADAFAHGRALDLIEHGLDYHDALRMAKRGPVTPIEQAAIDHARMRACDSLTGMGNDFAGKIREVIIEKNRQFMREMVAEGMQRKLTYQEIASEVGHATGDWGRDLFRIVYTEGHSFTQLATAYDLKAKFGVNPLTGKSKAVQVVKVPEKDACKYCFKLYVNTDGSLKVFDLDKMIEQPLMNTPYEHNGQIIRRQASRIGDPIYGWLAVLGAAHPYCRCRIALYFPHQHNRAYIEDAIAHGKLPETSIVPVNNWRAGFQRSMKRKAA